MIHVDGDNITYDGTGLGKAATKAYRTGANGEHITYGRKPSNYQTVTATSSSMNTSAEAILEQVYDLFISKHDDYGPDNIALSPFGPLEGLITRLHDKQSRAIHLVKNKQGIGQNEPLEDTFIDMIGYSLAAILVLRGEWPNVP